MIIRINGGLYATKVGDSTSDRYTIITTSERTFSLVEGTACIYESTQAETLKVWVRSDYAENLAKQLDIDEQRISRLRQALDAGYSDGGNRRAMIHDTAPDTNGRLKVVGTAPKQIIMATATVDTWQVVPSTQILVQPTAKPALMRWLKTTSVDDAAAKLAVGKRQITEIKRLLNLLRK